MRRIVGVLIAIALGIGVFVLWPRSSEDPPANTEAAGTSTTTAATEATLTTTISTLGETTTTDEESHVVETVEEAEEILRDLWFGWFEGIYNQDEDRIKEVVGNPDQVDAAVAQFGVMEFEEEPTADSILISGTEILRSDGMCLGVWGEASGTFRTGSISGVHVFRWHEDGWLLINTWPLREDRWEQDCDVVLD